MNPSIGAYIELVRSGRIPVCQEQARLVEMVERAFQSEDIRLDEEQLRRYLDLQKYFPYRLLEWESFCFALHNCVYRADGQLRWPVLLVMVGRGAGKNGYLAFEDFCLLTPVNGVREYHIDIFAMSEKQAKASWEDVYNVLESNKKKMQAHFRWTKEEIVNLKTRSVFRYNTSSPKTKDGARPGKVDFDEYHAYENNRLIEVAVTGLGKKPHPRRTIITTSGNVRGGPLDDLVEKSERILKGEIPDNGLLPFLCRMESEAEISNPALWPKANPSLPHFPHLRHEMEIEFSDYLQDPVGNSSFATKRMNRPQGNRDTEVASWDDILRACRAYPGELEGKSCVWGIDYASTQDFVAAGLLFYLEGQYCWLTHTWVCGECKDLSRIRAPLEEWARLGLLTFVNAVEINPSYPVDWLAAQRRRYRLQFGAIDKFRHTLLEKYLTEAGFIPENRRDNAGNFRLIRPGDLMETAPLVQSAFLNGALCWGADNRLMNWYTNNVKRVMDGKGNISYEKIEPRSRKTDGFMALAAAMTLAPELERWNRPRPKLPGVMIFD